MVSIVSPKVKVRSKNKVSKTGAWSDEKRWQAVTEFVNTGNLYEVHRVCRIPYPTLKVWKNEEWFKEAIKEVQAQLDEGKDSKYNKILTTTIDGIQDRLENGDHILDSKTGEVIRIPVKLKDLNRTLKDVQEQQNLIRHKPTKIVESASLEDKLLKLASKFQELTEKASRKPAVEISDVEYTLVEDNKQ